MKRNEHVYRTTRDVVSVIRFTRWDGVPVPEMDTELESRAGAYVFRGSARAFAAHLATLNAEHGADYALPD